MSLSAGTRIGPYEILGPLGAGAMGEVYRANDTRLSRDVALKIVRDDAPHDADARRRFRGEALALSRLNHPNVATIFDFGTHEDSDFLVMEFIPGESLADRLRAGPIPSAELLPLAAQLAEGLAAAHDAGVVHRDLKPANVRVTPSGFLKVVDFGLARSADPAHTPELAATETIAGVAVGTLAYMAPEVLAGARADARSDVFALGVVLYEMATARHPFPADTPIALVNAMANRSAPSPLALRPDLPDGLDAVIFDALRVDPMRRPASARDVLAMLRRLASGTVPQRPSRAPARTARSRVRSLVVLPLDNLSGDPAQDFFVDGITETLTAELSKLEGLRVISRTSAMRYRGARRPLPEIAAELGVDAVVEGSVMRLGDRVRVTAQLIHAASDTHLWADSFDRELSDVLTLQSEAARAIAGQIRVKLSPRSKARLAATRRVDPAAYEAYLRGRHHLNRRTEASLFKAADFFRQAIDADPTYALAHVGLGDVNNLLAYFSYLSPDEGFSRAQAAARRALELEPGLGEAHTSLAYTLFYHDWDWPAAEREFRQGAELSPNYQQAHLWYMNLMVAQKRFDEALQSCARVRELDPIASPAPTASAWVRYFMRDSEGSIAAYQKALELESGFGAAHFWFSWPLIQAGRFDHAVRELEAARGIMGDAVVVALTLAHARVLAGDHAGGRTDLEAVLAQSGKRHVPAYLVAFVYEALGESTIAWDWLERAAGERSHWLVYLDVESRFDPFRSDPRFEALRQRVGL